MNTQILKRNWKTILPIGNFIVAFISIFLWFLFDWDYLPEWIPFSPSSPIFFTINFFTPIIYFFCGYPIALVLIIGFFVQIGFFVNRISSRRLSESMIFLIGVAVLGISTTPWFFRKQIDDGLIKHALTRYAPAIEAIEKYKVENGEYPPTLDVLVPKYLPYIPDIYMKFGEELIYKPTPPTQFENVPFTFQISGSSGGSFSGQKFIYCPITIESCQETSYNLNISRDRTTRVNEWWLKVYSPW